MVGKDIDQKLVDARVATLMEIMSQLPATMRAATFGMMVGESQPVGDPSWIDWRCWRRSNTITFLAIALAGWLLFGWRVGARGLWSAHEGRAAQNAQAMLDTSDWLLPHLLTGDPDFQKPPLYYWLVTGFSWLEGEVTTQSVRLPAVLSAIAGLMLVYAFGRRLRDWETGVLATIILACTTRYAWLARVGRIDMPLCLICTGCLFVFFRFAHPKPNRPTDQVEGAPSPFAAPAHSSLSLVFYVLLAVGTLLKGPVAMALVAGPIVAFLAVTGQPVVPFLQPGWLALYQRLRIIPGVLLYVSLSAPWFAYAITKTDGRYFWEFFVYHNVDRALGSNDGLKAGPLWFYIPRLLVDFFPWSLFLPAMFLSAWKSRSTSRGGVTPAALAADQKSASRFLSVWIAVQFAFLSWVSFKRADYLLPVFPPLALGMACWLHDRANRFVHRRASRPAGNLRRQHRWLIISAIALASISGALLFWGVRQFVRKGMVHALVDWDWLEPYLNLTDKFMLAHIEQLLQANKALLLIALVVVVGSVWTVHTAWHSRNNLKWARGLAMSWLVVFLFQVHLLLPALDPLRDMSRFGEEIRSLATRERPIHYFRKFDADLIFHAGRPARMILGLDEVAELARSPLPEFLVVKGNEYLEEKDSPAFKDWALVTDNHRTALGAHRDPRVLLTNRPLSVADRVRRRRDAGGLR